MQLLVDTIMSDRLEKINELESEIFKEYIKIRQGRKPENIITKNGEFNNMLWIECEVDEVQDERERIESTTRIDGGTVDIY